MFQRKVMGEDHSAPKKPAPQGPVPRSFAKPMYRAYLQRRHGADKVVDEPVGLDLSSQGLRTLTAPLLNWPQLSSLYLAGNSLTRVSLELTRLTQLSVLDLSNNKIAKLPKDMGKMYGLRELKVNGNLLSSVPLEFGTLYQMEKFDLDDNPLVGQMQIVYNTGGGLGVLRYCRDNIALSLPCREREWVFNTPEEIQASGQRDTVTIGTYNILCPTYATSQAFSYVPSWALQWEARKSAILQEATSYGADILCIQEMDTASYLDFFREQFKLRGDYESVFYQKTRARSMSDFERRNVDGCAIFWRGADFQLVEQRCIPLSQLFSHKAVLEADHIAGRVMNKDNIALVVVLEKESGFIVVANVHIHWDPEFPDVKTLQAIMLTKELEGMMARYPGAELAVCGDFNSLPNSCPYELMSKGSLKPNCRDFQGLQYEPYSSKGYSHGLSLRDGYSFVNMGFTNFTPGFKGIIDYVWHNDRLAPICSLGPVDEEYVSKIVGIPTHHYPSDHLILMTQFRCRRGARRPQLNK